MNRLPDTTGMRDEAVVVRSQRNFYDHAVRAAGAHLVEVGLRIGKITRRSALLEE